MIKQFYTRFKKSCFAAMLMLAIVLYTNSVHGAEIIDRIVAIVNDDIIRLVELNKAFAPIEKQIKAKAYPPEKEHTLIYEKKMEALNNLIDDKLAEQEINRIGITVKDSEVDAAIAQVKSINMYSEEELAQALTAGGLSMAEYREELKKQILRNKLVSIEVTSSIIITQSDIAAYYNDHIQNYSVKKKYRMRNILMAYPPEDESKKAVQARMEEVLLKLKNGAPFDATAKEYSEGANAADGGKIGLIAVDDIAENIQPIVSAMNAGEFSSIIDTEQGFQIFYVDEIVDSQGKSVEEASEEIRQKLYEDQVNAKFKTWIESLRKDAHIKIMY